MNIPGPKSFKQYPYFIFGYLVFFFLTAFLISSLSILNRISSDGLYVNYYPCLVEGTDDIGRDVCEVYEKTPDGQVPVGIWLKDQAIVDLGIVSVIVIPIGIYRWRRFKNS
jgi:hypothetical protein